MTDGAMVVAAQTAAWRFRPEVPRYRVMRMPAGEARRESVPADCRIVENGGFGNAFGHDWILPRRILRRHSETIFELAALIGRRNPNPFQLLDGQGNFPNGLPWRFFAEHASSSAKHFGYRLAPTTKRRVKICFWDVEIHGVFRIARMGAMLGQQGEN
jgi:hypothetical protein